MLKQLAVVVLATATLGAVGCGESSSPSTASQSAPSATTTTAGKRGGGISEHDLQIVAGLHRRVQDWNATAGKWSQALGGNDVAHFLAVKDDYTARLNRDLAHLMVDPARIEDARLRHLMESLGRAYNRQFSKLVSVNDAVASGDPAAAQRAVAALQKAAQRKNVIAQQIAEAYPQLS